MEIEKSNPFQMSCPVPAASQASVRLAHGGGGKLMQELIRDVFISSFSNEYLKMLHDSAILPPAHGKLAFTTDSYVVRPLFFPGGDIGSLAVHGTINDLAMSGALPKYLSAALILEEGLPLSTLQRVADSMARTAKACGVQIVCGDTKVVDHGKGDHVFINTTGLGIIPSNVDIRPQSIEPGDSIIISGDLGSHGVAVLSVREGLTFSGNISSDSAPLHQVIADLIHSEVNIHCLRDLTRGGLASALNELGQASNAQFMIDETRIPVNDAVRGACEVLGLDPLYVANEGRFVMVLPPSEVKQALKILRTHPVSRSAVEIGIVQTPHAERDRYPVLIRTSFGTTRILDLLSGEQLPRIC